MRGAPKQGRLSRHAMSALVHPWAELITLEVKEGETIILRWAGKRLALAYDTGIVSKDSRHLTFNAASWNVAIKAAQSALRPYERAFFALSSGRVEFRARRTIAKPRPENQHVYLRVPRLHQEEPVPLQPKAVRDMARSLMPLGGSSRWWPGVDGTAVELSDPGGEVWAWGWVPRGVLCYPPNMAGGKRKEGCKTEPKTRLPAGIQVRRQGRDYKIQVPYHPAWIAKAREMDAQWDGRQWILPSSLYIETLLAMLETAFSQEPPSSSSPDVENEKTSRSSSKAKAKRKSTYESFSPPNRNGYWSFRRNGDVQAHTTPKWQKLAKAGVKDGRLPEGWEAIVWVPVQVAALGESEAAAMVRRGWLRASVSATGKHKWSAPRITPAMQAKANDHPPLAPKTGVWGDRTSVVVPGPHCPLPIPAAYCLMELEELEPSHLPLEGWRVNPDYPKGVQERRYHKDKAEQRKVQRQASKLCFIPRLLLNTDPTALNGPPVVTRKGIVLGGNSRAMTLELVSKDGRWPLYREELEKTASQFGLVPEVVKELKRPVLVRVVEDLTPDLPKLVTAFNAPLTQELEEVAASVSSGRNLSPTALAMLEELPENATLAAWLQTNASKPLVLELRRSGWVSPQQEGVLVTKQGTLSRRARAELESALLGSILPDAELQELLTLRLRDSLAKAAPFFAPIRVKGWDIRPDLPDGIRWWHRARASNLPAVANQKEIGGPSLRFTSATYALALMLREKSGPVQLPRGARRYAQTYSVRDQTTLLGNKKKPVASFLDAYQFDFGNSYVPRVFGMDMPAGFGFAPQKPSMTLVQSFGENP